MKNYYNEFSPYPAQWLRNLAEKGHILSGHVDERSILDVKATDLSEFRQCHFFAGIGGWPLALKLAGWPEDREVWTGSCPCQPFSSAGKQKGTKDERHLWPEWFRLIRECRPATIFGEQVASAIGHGWLDLVFDDLEREGYTCRSIVLPACSVGAPHKRDRLWFVADRERQRLAGRAKQPTREKLPAIERGGESFGMAGTTQSRPGGGTGAGRENKQEVGDDCGVVHPTSARHDTERKRTETKARNKTRMCGFEQGCAIRNPWTDCEWLPCIDGKARPTQPGLFPLAHGVSGRVGRLRAYGNAIVPQVAAEFINAFIEVAK